MYSSAPYSSSVNQVTLFTVQPVLCTCTAVPVQLYQVNTPFFSEVVENLNFTTPESSSLSAATLAKGAGARSRPHQLRPDRRASLAVDSTSLYNSSSHCHVRGGRREHLRVSEGAPAEQARGGEPGEYGVASCRGNNHSSERT